MIQKAIIIGATSGIGKALALLLLNNGIEVGLAGRRIELLSDIQNQYRASTLIKPIDITVHPEAEMKLQEMINAMGGIDLIIINSGVAFLNPELQWPLEKETIDVNVRGFTAMATNAMNHFKERGSGHLVGISSLSSFRGSPIAPAYAASKAYISNYLEGLQMYCIQHNKNIHVTDILPGFVDTPMIEDISGTFWVASAEKAAQQIYDAIIEKKKRAYITARWRYMAWLMRVLPARLLIPRNDPYPRDTSE